MGEKGGKVVVSSGADIFNALSYKVIASRPSRISGNAKAYMCERSAEKSLQRLMGILLDSRDDFSFLFLSVGEKKKKEIIGLGRNHTSACRQLYDAPLPRSSPAVFFLSVRQSWLITPRNCRFAGPSCVTV